MKKNIMSDKRRFIYALATFVGTIIGVGIFGLPYVGAKVGFAVLMFYLIGIGLLALVIHLFYSQFVLHTKEPHRLPGYAKLYLGSTAKQITFVIQMLGLFGSLLAYLIIGGQFLANFFNGSVFLYTFIFFILGAFLIWQDEKSIGLIEFILLFIFLVIVVFLFLAGAGHIEYKNLATLDLKYFFIPYGVILFSFWGASIIPEMNDFLKGDEKKLTKVIVWGIAICLIVYLLFSLLVIGISGSQTTEEGIGGLKSHLGQWVIMIGYIFGVITTFTSFITLGLTIKKIFVLDYHLPKWLSWSLSCFVPLILFIIGLQNFIKIIGLTGAITLGIEGIIITLIYIKLKKKQQSPAYYKIKVFTTAIVIFFIIGVVLEIFYSLKSF